MNDRTENNPTDPPSGGVQFASESAGRLLRACGLDCAAAAFDRGTGTTLRHRGRSVYSLDLAGAGDTPQRVFVKLNWGRHRLLPRMTDLKTGQMYQSLPVREWNGIERFASIGLNVPERMALFREGRFVYRDAVVVRQVPPEFSVDEMLESGRWYDLPRDRQSSLLRAMVSTMGRIHAAGLGWRGASSRHFYPRWQTDGTWKLWLIDCEGVHRAWSSRIVDRDCNKLWRAMRESGANAQTLAELISLLDSRRLDTPPRDGGRRAA